MVSSMGLVLAIVTIFIISMSQNVKADESLIQTLCDKTDFPGICKDCLHGDPAGQSADAVGLTKISIGCGVRSSQLFSDDLRNMWNTTAGPQALKDVLYKGWMGAMHANESMIFAITYIDQNAFDYANLSMYTAIPLLNYCVDGYQENLPGTPVPELIQTETAVVKQDAVIAIRLLTYLMEHKWCASYWRFC